MSANDPFKMHKFIDDCKKGRKENIAFLIGNGINLYCGKGKKPRKGVSWKDLLLKIGKLDASVYDEEMLKGISLLELYELIELQLYGSIKSPKPTGKTSQKENPPLLKLPQDVCTELRNWGNDKSDFRTNIVNKIKEMKFPILTTNFDDLMSQSISNSKIFKLEEKGIRKTFTHYYPWSKYFSDEELTDPKKGFAIWHIHGMIKHPTSIMLGFSHYITKMAYIKKRTVGAKNQLWENPDHPFCNTWLDIFYHKQLFIFGLDLGEQEIFLRWLLVQKAKHKRKHNKSSNKLKPPECGWYVASEHEAVPEGKKLFLQSVGIQICIAKDYKDIYETPWK